jgi:D-alanine transaminase/branched-chain amino acid aminotransferase
MSYAIINGETVSNDKAVLHINDLGLRRGYAVFEFFRVIQGVPLFAEDHLARLARSATLAELKLPYSREQLEASLHQLIEVNKLEDGAVQMILTGGYSEDIFTVSKPNFIMATVALETLPPDHFSKGVKLITYKHTRELAEAKTTAYLTAMRLSKRMKAQGAMEIVYYDDTRVYEASRSGLGFIKNNIFVTSKEHVLESVSMKHFLSLVRQALKVEERNYTLAELLEADEVFITGAIRGVIPVVMIDSQPIGEGAVGQVGLELMEEFSKHVEKYVLERQRDFEFTLL